MVTVCLVKDNLVQILSFAVSNLVSDLEFILVLYVHELCHDVEILILEVMLNISLMPVENKHLRKSSN